MEAGEEWYRNPGRRGGKGEGHTRLLSHRRTQHLLMHFGRARASIGKSGHVSTINRNKATTLPETGRTTFWHRHSCTGDGPLIEPETTPPGGIVGPRGIVTGQRPLVPSPPKRPPFPPPPLLQTIASPSPYKSHSTSGHPCKLSPRGHPIDGAARATALSVMAPGICHNRHADKRATWVPSSLPIAFL